MKYSESMNTRDLECFIKVYEYRSINIAAEKLYITPQGLSRIISRLEHELDCRLFNRDRGGSQPTECGDVLYRYALSMKSDYGQLVSEIDRIKRHENGVIRFAYSFGAMAGLTIDLPLRFQEKYPEYSLDYAEMPDAVVEELVESGEFDIGFAACIEPDRFNAELIHESKILFVPHSKSRFYERESVSVSEIADEPITLRNDNFTTTRIMDHEFEVCGKEPNVILNTGGILRSIRMVRENRANTVILDNVAEQFESNEVRTIAFIEDLKWPLFMIMKKGENQSMAVESFERFVKKNLTY